MGGRGTFRPGGRGTSRPGILGPLYGIPTDPVQLGAMRDQMNLLQAHQRGYPKKSCPYCGRTFTHNGNSCDGCGAPR